LREGAQASVAEVIDHLASRVAKWWLPDAVVRRGPAADGDREISKKHLRLQFQDFVWGSS
jgi:fatty-acyl-CoA synthase